MERRRFELERRVLTGHLGADLFKFFNVDSSNTYVELGTRTNSGNIYTLHVELDNFPFDIPHVYVKRMLTDKDGNALDKPSSAMHVLSPKNGWTRICHYGSASWTPTVSIFKVFVKCRLWLDMYELHLQTGKPIDYYLNHQE